MSDPSPARVLRLMEQLATHVVDELLAIRSSQQQQQSEQLKVEGAKPETKVKHQSETIARDGKQAETAEAAAETVAATSASSASAAASISRPPRRRCGSRRVKVKDTVIIQYEPAETNSSRDGNGVLQCHLTEYANALEVKEERGLAAAAMGTGDGPNQPISRWAATPPTRTRRKRKNNNNNNSSSGGSVIPGAKRVRADVAAGGSGSQQESCSQEDGGSQPVKAEPDADGDDQAAATEGEAVVRHGRNGAAIKSRQLVYPSRNGHRQLAALLKHMSSCYLKIQRSYKANIRELFYDDKRLFKSKAYSDSSIHLLCSILQLQRDELSLVTSAKGLIMGNLQFELEDFADPEAAASARPATQLVNCETAQTITPYAKQIRGFQCGATWVLIVEKDTVFSKIAQSGFPMLRNCLLITDKGMPTIPTRKFLRLLHTAFPGLPMWGLFDADPAGVGIYSEYKHGSAHSVSEGLALPHLQWLGLSLSDAEQMGVLQRSKLKLTAKDRTRINNLMAGVAQHDPDIKRELESMLSLDCKAEIESVAQLGDEFLTATYIPDKMEQLRRMTQERDDRHAADVQAGLSQPAPAEQLQSNADSFAHAAAAAAPSIKHELLAPLGHDSSIFGSLQADDAPAAAALQPSDHLAAASAPISRSEPPIDDDGLFAAFLGGASSADVDEENQWFA